jgi:hypothetical protein
LKAKQVKKEVLLSSFIFKKKLIIKGIIRRRRIAQVAIIFKFLTSLADDI